MKILLLRFSSIGDIVLTTPVARCLKQQTGAEVHFLTKRRFEEVLEANPYIDRLYTFDQDIREVQDALYSEKYDLIVDLHHNLRSLRLRWALGRPSVAFRKLNVEKWLLVNLKINRLPNVHIVDRYLQTVSALGVHNDGCGLDYFIPRPAAQILQNIQLPDTAFIAFAIGATHGTKRLPDTTIAAFCKLAKMPVVLLGGKAEEASGAAVLESAPGAVWDLCGRLTLHQSAAVLQRAAVVVTHDTGMMHIAAALRRPIVSVWGSTVPAFGMYPYLPAGNGPALVVEKSGLKCRPCSKIGYKTCPKGHFQCMKGIEAAQILEAINRLLLPN